MALVWTSLPREKLSGEHWSAVNHFGWEGGEEPSTTRVPGKTSLSSLIPREVATASQAPDSACARDFLAAMALAVFTTHQPVVKPSGRY